MNVGKNIRDGAYENTLPYPAMTDEESFKAREKFRKREQEVVSRFWTDVREEFGLSENNPRHVKLCSMAWDYGHAGGLSDVLSWVEELRQLL